MSQTRCGLTPSYIALSSMRGAGLVGPLQLQNRAVQSRSRTSASRSRTTALSSLRIWFSVLKFRVRRFDNDQTVMRCRNRCDSMPPHPRCPRYLYAELSSVEEHS